MEQSSPPLILCVDDDKVTLRAIERSLQNKSYAVLTAGNGQQALAILESDTPDLILLDAVMPEMDGYEVRARLRQNHKLANIPVIFVTALGNLLPLLLEEETYLALFKGARRVAADCRDEPFRHPTAAHTWAFRSTVEPCATAC